MKNKATFILLFLLTPLFISIAQATTCESQMKGNKCVQVSVQDKNGNAVSNIVVYLTPLDGQKLPQSSDIVTVSQKNRAFSPYITVSQTQKTVHFVNHDDITHHIYSADNDNKFAFKIRAGDEHFSENFNREAEIAMACNIHDWMSGYLLIVDTPYFAKTDNNGEVSFSLNNMGNYRVVVWHPQLPTEQHRLSQEQNIIDNTKLSFILTKDLESIPTQESSEGFDYDTKPTYSY
jgi:plastocyanin